MRDSSDNFHDALLASATLVLWLLCAVAGVVGFYVSYPRPAPPAPELQTQLVQVELPKDAAPPPPAPEIVPPPEPGPSSPDLLTAVPAAPPPEQVAEAPAVTPVAAPTAAVAFAVPVEGLTRIVDVSQAAHGAPAHPATTASGGGGAPIAPAPPAPRIVAPPVAAPPAAPTVLTFGQGEGRQPPPEYPRAAVLGQQEGTVVLRFAVDETGRVTSVEVAAASRWPVLNQAAVRAVRDTWHFAPGPNRLFEVPIQFQLSRNSS